MLNIRYPLPYLHRTGVRKKGGKEKRNSRVAESLWYPHELLNLVVIQLPLAYPSSVERLSRLLGP